MKKVLGAPTNLSTKPDRIVGWIFQTPVIVQGTSWLPWTQVGTWFVLAWFLGRSRDFSQREKLVRGILAMPVLLGSEWGHNLAHAYAAQRVGKPMDELRILWGMPRCVYHELNDQTITPRQHILRSLGGPLFNLCLLPVSALSRLLSREGSRVRDLAEVALQTNVFLSTVSLLPIPGIDGGPLVKWSLVERGASLQQADETIRNINGVLSFFLGVVSLLAFRKRKSFLGWVSALLSILSLGFFSGLILEEQAPF